MIFVLRGVLLKKGSFFRHSFLGPFLCTDHLLFHRSFFFFFLFSPFSERGLYRWKKFTEVCSSHTHSYETERRALEESIKVGVKDCRRLKDAIFS